MFNKCFSVDLGRYLLFDGEILGKNKGFIRLIDDFRVFGYHDAERYGKWRLLLFR